MDLSDLTSRTTRSSRKRVGRGGKRGTTSGHGTKGQKGRAGASVRPGFRGGDNRIWQLFPKQRGATKKLGNKRPHHKHRYFSIKRYKPWEINLRQLNIFAEGETVSPQTLIAKGLVGAGADRIKILGTGVMTRRLSFADVLMSATAKTKIEKAGGTIVS